MGHGVSVEETFRFLFPGRNFLLDVSDGGKGGKSELKHRPAWLWGFGSEGLEKLSGRKIPPS